MIDQLLSVIPQERLQDASFWTAVAFFLFLLLVYRPVKRLIQGALNQRRQSIVDEIQQAVQINHQAETVLTSMKEQCEEAEQDSEQAIQRAHKQAEHLRQKAKEDTAAFNERQKRMTQERIHQQEQQAILDIQQRTIHVALQATQHILKSTLSSRDHQRYLDNALKQFAQMPQSQSARIP
ncbi:MAG: hypothetical protein GDA50_05415 [Alphaproteobacteria bacterium GM202ARS2]|nr:hypothetical protein [Alphaproteobacteria bacterium GM202ARS2]